MITLVVLRQPLSTRRERQRVGASTTWLRYVRQSATSSLRSGQSRAWGLVSPQAFVRSSFSAGCPPCNVQGNAQRRWGLVRVQGYQRPAQIGGVVKKKQPMWMIILALIVFVKFAYDNRQRELDAANDRLDAEIRHSEVEANIARCRAGGRCG